MTDLHRLIDGQSIPKTHSKPVTEEELYWHMHEQGKKRFGSECRHNATKNGRCTNCLRKVI